jgi:S1-C subfamily serine protease
LPLGGIAVTPGALLFSLAGEFIGAVVMENGAPAIAGAHDVLDTGERLATAAAAPTDIGITVQPLTSTLAAALAAPRGVVVSEVHDGGPANGKLEPGDVITAVDDWSTDNPDELLLRLASHAAGDTVTITTLRSGETRTATVALEPATVRAPATSLAFAVERGIGTRVQAGGDVSVPGLEPGDTITRAGATMAPTPVQVRRALTQPTPTGLAVLIVRRDGRQRIIAVPVTGRGHAASR